MDVMVGLPTVGRHQTPGEQPADEACELLPLAGGEVVPEGRARRGRTRADSEAGGDRSGRVAAHGETPRCWARCRDQRASSSGAATAIVGGAAEAGEPLA